MRKLVLAGSLALSVFAAQSAHAAGGFAAEVNAARLDKVTGAELGIGYQIAVSKIRITPMVGAFITKSEDDRYRQETFSNGNTICRDLRNGQFAKEARCNNADVAAYGKVEATLQLVPKFQLGGGVRVSEDRTLGYGVVSAFLSDKIALKAFGGKDYYGGGLSLVF